MAFETALGLVHCCNEFITQLYGRRRRRRRVRAKSKSKCVRKQTVTIYLTLWPTWVYESHLYFASVASAKMHFSFCPYCSPYCGSVCVRFGKSVHKRCLPSGRFIFNTSGEAVFCIDFLHHRELDSVWVCGQIYVSFSIALASILTQINPLTKKIESVPTQSKWKIFDMSLLGGSSSFLSLDSTENKYFRPIQFVAHADVDVNPWR